MKKIVLAVAALAMTVSAAHAGITGTKHDLSGKALGTTQICIFCHTPHNAVPSVPLWNRNAQVGIYTKYDSATLTTVAKAATVNATTISGFCLSCHDNTLAIGSIRNTAGATMDNVKLITDPTIGTAPYKANLGTDLSNDHPVGFAYDTAVTQDGTGLIALATANATLGGNAFFGVGANVMECASCHKVHDNTNAPFLRIANTNSTLCLACHNK